MANAAGRTRPTAAPAWPERSLQWMKREEFHGGMEYPEIVQVGLQGRCKADLTTDWWFADGPLGWVYMTGGEIQPVVYVNCDRIGQTAERETQFERLAKSVPHVRRDD